MKVYIFQASLYCEPCMINSGTLGSFEPSEDSDRYPQGPYGNGGGEADNPQLCECCGQFLENPLTPEGLDLLREMITQGQFIDSVFNWEIANYYRLAMEMPLLKQVDGFIVAD